MSNVIPFNYHDKEVRTIQDEDGNLWFVAKDVAEILGYSNARDAVRRHCKKARPIGGGRETRPLDPQTKIIPEPDVYRLIMKSNLPAAEEFEAWVLEEVLPTIRKTGSYATPAAPKKEAYELELLTIESCARLLNYSDASRLGLLHAVAQNNGVSTAALPEYTRAVRPTFSASDLLKRNDCGMSAIVFNKLMIASGLMEEKERTASRGRIRKFKVLTDAGLKYGQNDTSKHNPREVQIHYFEDTFMELFDSLTQEDAAA